MERLVLALTLCAVGLGVVVSAQRTVKPVLHAQHWLAITGKPLAATAGAMMFEKGGNAVDAACAMLAATSTMWDTLGWGGETQALIYNPQTGEGRSASTRWASRRPARRPSSSAERAWRIRPSTGRSRRSRPARPAA